MRVYRHVLNFVKENKLILIIFVIYFFLAWILSWDYFIAHLSKISSWRTWHEQLMAGELSGSNQFRLLAFWLPQLFSVAFEQGIVVSYLMVRFFFTFITFCLFHLFLLKWFDHKKAFLSVVLLAAIIPFTYLPFFQEADVIHLFFFLIGLWLIREKKNLFLPFLIFIATFNKETIVFLIPFYFLFKWQKHKLLKITFECLIFSLIWYIAFVITRNAFYTGQNSEIWQLPHNIAVFKYYFIINPFIHYKIFWIPLFGIFWLLSFLGLKEKPKFLQVGAYYIIIFMILHFLFGWPEETRIILPLAFIIIPSSILYLFPDNFKLKTT